MVEDTRTSYILGGIELFVGAAAVLIAPAQRILIVGIGGILGALMALSAIFWNPILQWKWPRIWTKKIPTEKSVRRHSEGIGKLSQDEEFTTTGMPTNAELEEISLGREMSLRGIAPNHIALHRLFKNAKPGSVSNAELSAAIGVKKLDELKEPEKELDKIKASAFVYLSERNSAVMAAMLRGNAGNVENLNLSQDPIEEICDPLQNEFASLSSSRKFTFNFKSPISVRYRPIIAPVISGDNRAGRRPILVANETEFRSTQCSFKIDFHKIYEFPINITFEAY